MIIYCSYFKKEVCPLLPVAFCGARLGKWPLYRLGAIQKDMYVYYLFNDRLAGYICLSFAIAHFIVNSCHFSIAFPRYAWDTSSPLATSCASRSLASIDVVKTAEIALSDVQPGIISLNVYSKQILRYSSCSLSRKMTRCTRPSLFNLDLMTLLIRFSRASSLRRLCKRSRVVLETSFRDLGV